jgi:hypothetical protein
MKDDECRDTQQDVEAAAFSYTQLHAIPAVDDQSTSAGKRVASDVDAVPVKGAPAKKRK